MDDTLCEPGECAYVYRNETFSLGNPAEVKTLIRLLQGPDVSESAEADQSIKSVRRQEILGELLDDEYIETERFASLIDVLPEGQRPSTESESASGATETDGTTASAQRSDGNDDVFQHDE
jgi:hypothetical protein